MPDRKDLAGPQDPKSYGPIVAKGEEGNWGWEFRADIREGRFVNSFAVWDRIQGHPKGRGYGAGALPFDSIGDKKLGHFGAIFGGGGRRKASLRYVAGVVSRQVNEVRVELEDGQSVMANVIDAVNPEGKFFLSILPVAWQRLAALAEDGSELDISDRRELGRQDDHPQ